MTASTATPPLDKQNWTRCLRGINKFRTSEVGDTAMRLFTGLVILLFLVNGLNVVGSYVGRNFMTAIANRQMSTFLSWALLYVGVFAAGTVVAVIYRYSEERLGLLWREWLTRRLVDRYFQHPTYYRLADVTNKGTDTKNPDQRIADDVRAFTSTTLSFILILINAALTILAFSGVLWSISPTLFGVAVLYAIIGSILTFVLGRPLIALNYDQLDREANFRSALIHLRENAETVAQTHDEGLLKARALRFLQSLVENTQRIIVVNRNVGFFTTGYNNLIQILPALIIAPLFIRGEVEFGVITQATIAFGQLLVAFSLVVNQFQALTWFAAVIVRLASLMEAMDVAQAPGVSNITHVTVEDRIAYDNLSLCSPHDGQPLVQKLTLANPIGQRLLIRADDEMAKTVLFRATNGIWTCSEGQISMPPVTTLCFVPESPYLPPGTLRDLFTNAAGNAHVTDTEIDTVLAEMHLDTIVARGGGLDTEIDWNDMLSLSELKLLAVARACLAVPRFVFFDRPGTALSASQVDLALTSLHARGITYLVTGSGKEQPTHFDATLSLVADGTWTFEKHATKQN
jgi:vitamin B12/bleomycin/antimicrobial peptide transport system ATP-binding/permease protein